MQRDNSFDLGLRDIADIRNAARHAHNRECARHDIGGIGAGSCAMGDTYESLHPSNGDYSIGNMERLYLPDTQSAFSVAGQTIVTLTMNPTEFMMCPIAVALVGTDSTDPGVNRLGRVYAVDIKGCQQLPFTNATETVAAATQFVPSQTWDPTNKSGCACPVNWGCYSNQGLNNARMTIRIGNPHPAGISANYTLVVYGVPFTCCPQWTDSNSYYTPRPRMPSAAPSGSPAPAGRIPFARG